MRVLAITFPLLSLAGCIGAPAANAPAASVAPAAPFVVPMDPGQITCAEMANSAALSEGARWVMGQARAAVLSGGGATLANEADAAARIAAACTGNPALRLTDVSRGILG